MISPSTTGHEKPRGNPGRPLSKAKYSLATDSEQVPRGKGEKHPERGVKQYLKPYAYNRWEAHTAEVPARVAGSWADRVPFVE